MKNRKKIHAIFPHIMVANIIKWRLKCDTKYRSDISIERV